jgi:hypothetical protein
MAAAKPFGPLPMTTAVGVLTLFDYGAKATNLFEPVEGASCH